MNFRRGFLLDFVLIPSLAGIIVGCAGDPAVAEPHPQAPTTNAQTPAAIRAPTVKVELEIIACPSQVSACEPIRLKYRVTNTSDKVIICGFSDSLQPGINVYGSSPLSGKVLSTEYYKRKANAAALSYANTLEPKATYSGAILINRFYDMTMSGKYSFKVSMSALTVSGEPVTSAVHEILIEVKD